MTTAKALSVVPQDGATLNVFQALQAVMREMKAVGKDSVNEQQRFRFRGIDAVMNAAHPLFAEHGVLMVPTVLERLAETRETKSGGSMNVVHLRIRYRFYGPAGDYLDSEVWAEAQDSADKATNKALAAGMKYALFQTLCIPTEDQPDADATTIEASRASDPQIVAELELKLEQATTKQALRTLFGEAKVAFMAKRINGTDCERIQTECTERAALIDKENAESQHEQDNADDAAAQL